MKLKVTDRKPLKNVSSGTKRRQRKQEVQHGFFFSNVVKAALDIDLCVSIHPHVCAHTDCRTG